MKIVRCKNNLVYTVKELAKILNIGMNSAYKLTHRKDFPSIKIGRKILIPKAAFYDWLKSSCFKAAS
jgi:excisionase family DNA binding protein